jgi:DHA1 family bicyclomycin/chloramphenicol resistance-like MFS transporter
MLVADRIERGQDVARELVRLVQDGGHKIGVEIRERSGRREFIEARYGTIGMWPFLLCFAPQIATISLIGPNSMAMALQRYPHMAGTASSLMGVMQFGIGALFGAVVGQTMDGTIAPMTTAMGIAGVLCLVSHRLLVRRG